MCVRVCVTVCGVPEIQNRPTPFPGWMSQEATEPGLSCNFSFFSLLDRGGMFFVIFFSLWLCLVRYPFVISTSVIDCLEKFVSENNLLIIMCRVGR